MLSDENDDTATGGESQQADARMLADTADRSDLVVEPQIVAFERRLEASWPDRAWRDVHVVLAVSGGADSVALLRAMVAIKERYGGAGRLFVAHLNHGLRGDEADADAAWLVKLCEHLHVRLEIASADVAPIAAAQGDGWEAAARDARYSFLLQAAERLGARFVVTAHTADDQIETVLQRIVRGTGLAGLAGIQKARALSNSVTLVRPLLSVGRSEIVSYLATLGQDYRTDSSNADLRYTRNRLRHELLPVLRERYNSDVDGALARLAMQSGEAQDILEGFAAEIAREAVTVEFGSTSACQARRVQVDCVRLTAQPAIVVREVCKAAWRRANWPLQAMGFHEWQLLASLVRSESSKNAANLPQGIHARRERDLLILEVPSLP